MREHVTSLELSRKLKAAGVKQESEFYWIGSGFDYSEKAFSTSSGEHGQSWYLMTKEFWVGEPQPLEKLSAFLASELLEMLPLSVSFKRIGKGYAAYFRKPYENAKWQGGDPIKTQHGISLPEAAGEMVLWWQWLLE